MSESELEFITKGKVIVLKADGRVDYEGVFHGPSALRYDEKKKNYIPYASIKQGTETISWVRFDLITPEESLI